MTLKEFLQNNESSIGESGGNWNDCNSLNQLNKARSILYSTGIWDGMIAYTCISNCYNGRLIVPWFADQILDAYTCKKRVTIETGEYFSIVDKSYCGKQIGITDTQTYSPTPVDLQLLSRGLSITSGDMDDQDKIITIVYLNNRGSVITDEIEIDQAFKKYRTSTSIKKIVSISKPASSGEIHFHSNSKGCPYLFTLSPYETNPQYRVYCVNGNECNHCFPDGGCCSDTQIVLKLKKKHFTFTELHYNHQIDFNSHALALAMQSIPELEKRTPEGLNMHRQLIKEALDYLKKNNNVRDDKPNNFSPHNYYPEVVHNEFDSCCQ